MSVEALGGPGLRRFDRPRLVLGPMRRLRVRVGYPRRYLLDTPAWLECWRHDFRDDIEAEYLYDQRQTAEAVRKEIS